MSKKEIEDAARDKRIDEIADKFAFELDDICHEIFLTLMAYKNLRFNELHRYLRKFGTEISKPSLIEHLKHLTKQKLVKRKRADSQNVSYSLTEEILSLVQTDPENVKGWLDYLEKSDGRLPHKLRILKLDEEKYYENMPEKELDREVDQDLESTCCLNLHELKNMIDYDLRVEKDESGAAFWKFIGNPLYRMHEKTIAGKCRASDRYREKLFAKINRIIDDYRTRNTPTAKK